MSTAGVKRNRALVLAADVQGFTHFWHAQETTALTTLSDCSDTIDGLTGGTRISVFGQNGSRGHE